ncbi:MAG: DUF3040 domain-containing protein [Micrococcales bacterium]|nr:DUF3040 domain-containing protein [Micrococcales bacterium]NBR60330.1 DUF3040 domain-containing protein [Actinomycetota bacterium]NBT46228.1 DUF3040 domain-containing protein [Actinomycetota bacterium]NBY43500.1 DUF3040 domain-containing protein [Micrococcales bacterium]NDE88433.1 DUF3040 domain-containing protein [Micrococcales bacterium]
MKAEATVSLSDKERQVLEELERQLTGAKPKAKGKPEQASSRPANYALLLVLGSLLAVFGLGIMIFSTSSHQIWLGVFAFLFMLVGLYLVSQNWSSKAIKNGQPSKKPKDSRESLLQKLWDERNNGK